MINMLVLNRLKKKRKKIVKKLNKIDEKLISDLQIERKQMIELIAERRAITELIHSLDIVIKIFS